MESSFKKKIVAGVASLALIAGVAGVSNAFLSDKTEVTDNVLTVGNVDITLNETFEQNSKLIPGTSSSNTVKKEVNVTNTGSENAYVRVHLAIPSALVDQNINAYNDVLHVNFTAASAAPGKWSWHPTNVEGNGWTDNGRANNNVYNTTINGEDYTVWVITYRTPVGPGSTTENAIHQVYLDSHANTSKNGSNVIITKPVVSANGTVSDTETMTYTAVGGKLGIKVMAEGVQSDGFEDAYTALNTTFGTPGSEGYVSPFNK